MLRNDRFSSYMLSAAGVVAAGIFPSFAYAQTQPQPAAEAQTGDIVVTAQRREETLQRTPLAISAVGGNNLRGKNISDLSSLSNTFANVDINISNGLPRVTVRGIGNVATQTNVESQLAYHVDGIYIGRPEATSDGFFDVKRLELVRGPQGTLYGRNATSGAINVITGDPTDRLDGYVDVTGGTFELIKVEAAIGGPIATGISARLAVQSVDRGGYGKDGTGRDLQDQHSKAVRGKLKFELSPNLQILLSADYYHQDDASSATYFANDGDATGLQNRAFVLGGTIATDRYHNTTGNYPTRLLKDNWGVGGKIDLALASWVKLTSLTAYRDTDFMNQLDFDATQADVLRYLQTSKSRQFSQELRFGGQLGKFNYVIGGYYYDDSVTFRARIIRDRRAFDPTLSPQLLKSFYQIGTLDTTAYAAFGQIGYDFTDWIGIDIGGRQSWETKTRVSDAVANVQPASLPYPTPPTSAGYPILLSTANFYNDNLGIFDAANLPTLTTFPQATAKFSKFTPKATLRVTPAKDVLLYFTYSQGFRSGGFTLGSGGSPYDPEVVDNFEGGIKARWLNGKLTTNLSVFHYNYTNLQVITVNPAGGANIVASAGKARIDGAELEVVVKPSKGVQFDLTGGYTDAKYVEFSTTDAQRPGLGVLNLAGFTLPQAPKLTFSAGAQYTTSAFSGEVTIRGDMSYRSKTYFSPFDTDALAQDSYALFNAYVNYEGRDGHWFGAVFVKNIGNKHYWASKYGAPVSAGAFDFGQSGAPRTAGLRVGYRF